MATKPVPARLHVLLARDAPLGLVIRRGPTKQVCTLLWDRRTDEFTLGAVAQGAALRGAVRPVARRPALYLLRLRRQQGAERDRGVVDGGLASPYLKALSLYGVGHTWWAAACSPGPAATGQRRRPTTSASRPRSGGMTRSSPYEGFCSGDGGWTFNLYDYRLVRDGWRCAAADRMPHLGNQFARAAPGGWTLVRVLLPNRKSGTGRFNAWSSTS